MKIDFFIAGFQKAATTKLKDVVSQNSFVVMHEIEEMTYFIDDEYNAKNGNRFLNDYYVLEGESKLLGAKNVSMAVCENSIRRLKEHNPECKIILMLRNPIQRARSAFWYCRRMGWESSKSLEEAIERPLASYPKGTVRRNCDYIGQGDYFRHISVIYKHFPREQVRIYILEEDVRDLESLNVDVSEFLDIPVEEMCEEDKASKVNSSAMPRFLIVTKLLKSKSRFANGVKDIVPSWVVRKVKSLKGNLMKMNERDFTPPEMSQALKVKLGAIYMEKNKNLETLIDRDLSCWLK